MDIDANKEHRATIGQADKNPKMRKTFKALSVIDGLSSSGYLSKSQDIEADLIDTISTPKHASSKSEINEISQNTLKYRTVIPCKSKNASKSQGRSIDNLFPRKNSETLSHRYRKILPFATRQMENKLCQFLDTYNKKFFEKLEATPCEIFAAKQIVKIALSVCHMLLSLDQSFTQQYFIDLSNKIDTLIQETAKKCPEELTFLIEIAQKFDLITSETVRVLACIEYNHCKNQPPDAIANLQNTDQDLKSYIQQMLGETETLDKEKANQSELIIWKSQKLYTIAVKFPQNDGQNIGPSSSEKYAEFSIPKESDFTVVKLISQGAFGAVYLVKHNATKRRYAMKKIHKTHALLKNQVRQIFAERDILSFTENPFVISMLCSFETKNSYCMVMEFAEGGDCASLIKSIGILSVDMARSYIAETIVAVEYIHNYGIIHRDIKPDNLLITSMGHIKLTDFGLSKIGLMNLTTLKSNDYLDHFRDKNIQGTPDYIAPEVVLNKPYGRPADYWSIGIVLYEFLVGCTPFYGLTLEEIFESIVSSTLEWPSKEEGPPEEAQDIIIKLLNRNPLTRICSDLAKRHPFFRQIKWNCLLQTKAEFIPSFSSDDDTSFFDDRCERYNHNQLYLKNDPSVETTNSSAFTSYTKLFMDQTTKKPFSTSDPLFSEELSDTSITPESIYLSSDDSCFASSQIKKETEKSDSQLGVDDIPKKEEISISHYLQQIVQKIEIKRKSLAHDFGFSFKTDRVKCCKNISFLNHTVNFVRSQSPAFMSGLIPGMSIVFINNLTVIGQQHVKVLTTFANLKSICVEVCSLSQMDISVSNKSNPVYSFDIRSQFFNELVELQVVFEKRVNTEYNQVLLDHTCNIVQKLPEIFPYQRFKKNKKNVFSNFLRRLVERTKSNVTASSTLKQTNLSIEDTCTSQQQISRKLSMELPITPNKLKPCAQPKLSLAKKYPVYYKISKKDTIETPDSMQCLPVSLSPRASLIRITSQKLKAVKDILKHIT